LFGAAAGRCGCECRRPRRCSERERGLQQRQSRHHLDRRRRESRGLARDRSRGSTISQGENPAGLVANLSGTFVGFQIVFSPAQAAGSQVASYAYVGEAPPSATDTAEFFVFYQCTTREVLLSCYGPYGTCPQTAQQALALLAPGIPTQGPLALSLTALL
jgi:hypothetical protein